MTKLELQKEFEEKCKKVGFSNVKTLVRNYSISKTSLEKAIEKVNKIIAKMDTEKVI